MPGVSGLEAVKVISEEMPDVHVLMLTVSEDAQDLMDALRAGASTGRSASTRTPLDSFAARPLSSAVAGAPAVLSTPPPLFPVIGTAAFSRRYFMRAKRPAQ